MGLPGAIEKKKISKYFFFSKNEIIFFLRNKRVKNIFKRYKKERKNFISAITKVNSIVL